jgi:2-polyprenyl-3-methyl-5-hydroxy-6-metoxy-1,4-benzoquinol methylase
MSESRLRIEKRHYDEFYREHEEFFTGEVDMSPIHSPQLKPYNPYWKALSLLRQSDLKDKRVLDCGCGSGYYSIQLAALGALVHGVDISRSGIELARRRASPYGFEKKVSFSISSLEQLPFGENSFDFLFGMDILHHVDLVRAIPELKRILKPGGIAVFKEWKRTFLFDSLRNSSLGLRLFPKKRSKDRIVDLSPTEKKLSDEDLKFIRKEFGGCRVFYSRLLSRLGRFFPNPEITETLEKFDARIMIQFSALGRLSGEMILLLRK